MSVLINVSLSVLYALGIMRSKSSLCEPSEDVCQEQVDISVMTSTMCQAWAHILPFLDPEGVGTQIKQVF